MLIINQTFGQTISINSTFSADSVIYPFQNSITSYGLKITGHVVLNSDTSLVRVILVTNTGNEFMAFEAYPLIVKDSSFNITDVGDETYYLNGVTPHALRIEIINAEITVEQLVNSTSVIQNAITLQFQKKQSQDLKKIEILRSNLTKYGFNWIPGENDVSKWYYSKKKQYWGEKYNLYGYDYYTGGIFKKPNANYANITSNPYVNVWDWRNRHEANNESSPYYDGYNGWLTTPKNQFDPPGCGSCSAFATFGSFEATINLYYNQHLDLDLSEQEQLSCNPQVSCSGGMPSVIFPYIRDYGVVTEECFPYQADDQIPCSDKCDNPETTVTLTNYEEHQQDPQFHWSDVQHMLITKGPLAWIKNGGTHAITLMGYIYDNSNDQLYLIQKESLGPNWGDNGYLIEPAPANYLYVGTALDATVTSNNPPQVLLRDEDGDGYDNWGIGPRPAGASAQEDCDDANPSLTLYNSDYSCHCQGEYAPGVININNGDDIHWDQNMAINQNVIINYGGTLTITAEIFIHKYVHFIVKPGGKLYIDGGHLTKACSDFWKGIEVSGDVTKPQLNTQPPYNPYKFQGYISITNGGTIEYAKIGILTGEIDNNNVMDYTKAGGIVYTNDAIFRNNIVDVRFLPYSYDADPFNNQSAFYNTDFITHDDELTLFTPEEHLYLDGVYGIHINACNFTFQYNGAINTETDDRGIGIYATDASFSVIPICTSNTLPCNQWDPCTFTGLRYGIKAMNTGEYKSIHVKETNFDNCVAGIYLSGYNLPEIISNNFNTQFDGSLPEGRFYGGVFLDGCTGYHVENNIFYANYLIGILPSKRSIGIYIKDSGEEDNEIYNNKLHNLDIAIVAEGINKDDTTGLTIKCNDMWDNGNDIFVIENPDVGFTSKGQGIKYMQGANSTQTEDLAGNTFSNWVNGTPAWADYFWNYRNDVEHFDYFHHKKQNNPLTYPLPDNYTPLTIALKEKAGISFIKSDACPSHLNNGGTQKALMVTAASNITTYQTQLDTLTDGGNTEATNDSIYYTMPGGELALRNQLLSKSPYLSDTVLKTAALSEQELPNTMLRDVLVANPQAAKNNEIIDAAANRADTMPGYMMNDILGGLNIVGAKEMLESKVAHWQGEYHRAFNELARSYFSDTLNPAPYDSLIALFQNEDDINIKYHLAFAYLNKKDTTQAINLIDSIGANYTFTGYHFLRQSAYEDYFNIIDSINANHIKISQLDSSAVATLTNIKNLQLPKISEYATGMLVKGGFINFTERIALPAAQKSARVYSNNRPFVEKTKNGSLKLMPNPARNYLIIGYDIQKESGQGIIIIRDVKGNTVKNLGLHQPVNQITVDMSGVPSGIYVVSLYAGNKHIVSKKLSVTH